MSDTIQINTIQINTAGRLPPCLQKKIDKTVCLAEVHFSATSTQCGLFSHGKQGKSRKLVENDEYVDKLKQDRQSCLCI